MGICQEKISQKSNIFLIFFQKYSIIKGGSMEGNNKEGISEKEAKFRELMWEYSEMGEKMYAMAKELGHVDEKKEELKKELEAMLGSEFWVFQIDEIKQPFREDYLVHIERKLPIEKETGKPEISLEF